MSPQGAQDGPGAGRLHHLLLEVADIEEAERFYVGLLGFEIRSREPFRDGRPFFNTSQGLGITTAGEPRAGLRGHVAFGVRDVEALVRRVAEAGYQVLQPPGDGPYGHTAYVADPDGNEVELIEEEG